MILVEPILVEHRRTLFSELSEVRTFDAGATIAGVVEHLPVPAEFASHGAVYLKRDLNDPGHMVPRQNWRLVRPKPGTALFVSCVPQGGGDKGKGVFAVIAAIALIALTAWVGGGGLAFLGPAFASGSVGAQVAAAAITLAGTAALGLLTRGLVGGSDEAAESTRLGVAGITQNAIRPFRQVPAPLGLMRISPPMLARPWTTIEDTDQFVHLICGVCGPAEISAIKINETDLGDLPSGQVEVETREGWLDDAPLTLVTQSAFEENINLQMSTHRLDKDNTTLLPDAADSYPQPHIFRTARDPDRFRVTLHFPQGLARFDSSSQRVLIALRIEVRRVGEMTWRKLPEIHLEAALRAPMRQEIWLYFGGSESELLAEISGETSLFVRFYAQNPEWTADAYFNASPGAIDSNAAHILAGADQLFVFLDPAEFPRGDYDVRMQRSFAQNAGAQHTATAYTGGLFTYRTETPPNFTIPNQADFGGTVVIQSYTSFRDQYPIAQPGLTLIAVKAKNIRVSSVSALLEPYVPIWDGSDWDTVAPSSNPAALVRWVRTGWLNKRPADPALSDESLDEFYDYCESKGLSCQGVITQGSVEQAAALAANTGDALMRESDRWGVVIDRDRSGDGIQHLFGPHNMTSPLVMQRKFLTGARGVLPAFTDAARDYAVRELDRPVFDDGVPGGDDLLVEAIPYDGYADEALVRRRAKLDVRRVRLRATRYSWECHQEQLVAIKGDLVGLAHDILVDSYATGRVKGFSVSGGFLRSVTLNTNLQDLPIVNAEGVFEVERVFRLGDVFDLSVGPKIGLQIRLKDNTIATFPVAGVEDATLMIEGDVAAPAGLKRTCLAAVGPRERETRRVLITNIVPRRDQFARLEAVDEAPQIHEGL